MTFTTTVLSLELYMRPLVLIHLSKMEVLKDELISFKKNVEP